MRCLFPLLLIGCYASTGLTLDQQIQKKHAECEALINCGQCCVDAANKCLDEEITLSIAELQGAR